MVFHLSHCAHASPPSPNSRSNIIHGSDAVESAQREIALWFPEFSTGIPNYDVRKATQHCLAPCTCG